MSSHFESIRALGMQLMKVTLVALLLLVFSLGTASAEPGIEEMRNEPAGKKIALELAYVDFRVAAFGGDIVLSREFVDGKWLWNRPWLPVSSNRKQQSTGSSKSGSGFYVMPDPTPWYVSHDRVRRYKASFDVRSGSSTSGVRILRAAGSDAPGEHFELSENGLVWRDKNGNWIRYAPTEPEQVGIYGGPAMDAYVHSYGTALYANTFERDTENRVTGVRDTFGNLLVTISYAGSSDRPSRIEDYSGRTVKYNYNAEGQLVEVIDVRGQAWSYAYAEDGRIESMEDPNGNVTAYEYTQNSLAVVGADQLKTTYRYQYDKAQSEFRRTEERPDGSVRESIYNNASNVPSSRPKYEFYVDGELVRQRFGSQQNPRYRDAAGEETVFEKNEYQKTTRITYPDGTDEQWIYSSDGRHQLAYINRKGVRTEWDYDSKDRVTEIRRAVGLQEQQTIRFSYPDLQTRITTVLGDQYTPDAITTEIFDQYGNTVSITDAEGHTVNYTYNVLGQVITETRPTGAQYSYEYDPAGNVVKVTDPLARVTLYSYDGSGNLVTETWPNNATTTHRYNALNQKVGSTNARNETVETVYDRVSRTFALKNAKGAKTQVRLNSQGMAELIEDPNGNQTRQTYDSGRLVSTQHPTFEQNYEYAPGSRLRRVTDHFDGKQASTGLKLDPLGQVLEQNDANNNPEQRQYDAFGQLTEITDALGGITRLTYDVHGNLVKVTDPEGRETRFEYDGNGQVIAEERYPTPSQVSRRSYRYDADGNLATEITPNGEKAVYTYNDADELVTIEIFDDQASITSEQTISLAYNTLGQLTSYDDGETQGAYSYDDVGQLIAATTDYGPFSKTISYTYDAAGNVATYTNPEGITYTYSYDHSGLIRSINIPGTGVIAFSEYQWTQPTRITLPGGTVIKRQYDGLQRMASNTLLDPAQNALMAVLYGYDPVGNILSQSTEHGDYAYGYDNLYRLTEADYPAASEETFEYDGVGNRTNQNGGNSWIYNKANQLVQQAGISYKYDANGHLIKKTDMGQDTYFFYNSQERLVQVEDHNHQLIARYGYNPFGHRVWKEVGEKRTYFLYNHSGLVGEYNSGGRLIKEYHYTPASTWMTGPIFQRTSESLYFYQTDHLGTPQLLISSSGQVAWASQVQAFGQFVKNGSITSNNLRFAGQYYDEETGLHHNYFRDYDIEVGRYIQSDPKGLYDGPNTYTYVHSNPINYIDPTGQWGIPGGVYGAISGGIGGYISGGWRGALAGVGTGALVGAVNPFGASAAGAAAGAGVASLLGQGAGNVVSRKDVFDLCNYDFSAAAGAAMGGALGGPLGNAVGRYVGPYRYPIIGRPLNAPGISRAPGNTVGATVEGVSVGVGELGGQQL